MMMTPVKFREMHAVRRFGWQLSIADTVPTSALNFRAEAEALTTMSADDETRTRTDTVKYYRHIPSVLRLPISPHQRHWLQGREVSRKATSWFCLSSPLVRGGSFFDRGYRRTKHRRLFPTSLAKAVSIVGVDRPNPVAMSFNELVDPYKLATDPLGMVGPKQPGNRGRGQSNIAGPFDSVEKGQRQITILRLNLFPTANFIVGRLGRRAKQVWHFLIESANALELRHHIANVRSGDLRVVVYTGAVK